MKKSEITRQGLDNVGFIGGENGGPLRTTLLPKRSPSGRIRKYLPGKPLLLYRIISAIDAVAAVICNGSRASFVLCHPLALG
jgi:hypothetical protein